MLSDAQLEELGQGHAKTVVVPKALSVRTVPQIGAFVAVEGKGFARFAAQWNTSDTKRTVRQPSKSCPRALLTE